MSQPQPQKRIYGVVDVAIVGGGPGGLAAARGARKAGAQNVVVLERERNAGGILNQCIHEGFGIHRYHAQLSGPEYAERAYNEAIEVGAEIRTGTIVARVTPREYAARPEFVVEALSPEGLYEIVARSVVFATGCRERTRGAISIPGSRPAGVYTAGVAQNLINTKNIMVGHNVVILGSGDIGLIMARRLTLEGANVIAVVEFMPEPSGLTRNVSQCLFDYDIPLYTSHTVSRIIGKQRLEAVEIAEVDEDLHIVSGTEQLIACDTLVLSVGLIPENEVATYAGVALDPKTNGVVTDEFLQSNVPGIFSCGNSHAIMDLVDFVSQQGELAGTNAAHYSVGESLVAQNAQKMRLLPKGMPLEDVVICSLCPNGCQVLVLPDGSTSGNLCGRGRDFALQEMRAPERILTTTMRVEGAQIPLIPVRSDRPVKKKEIIALVHDVSTFVATAPIMSGQILVAGMGENEVNIVSERSVNALIR